MEQSVSQGTAVNHAAELDQILTSYKVQFCQFKICFSKCHRNVIDLMVFELAVSCEKSLTFARNKRAGKMHSHSQHTETGNARRAPKSCWCFFVKHFALLIFAAPSKHDVDLRIELVA